MKLKNVFLIFRREVVDQLRDRRTLFMVAVLPVLLYPMLGIGTAQMTAMFTEQPRTVVILGAADLPAPALLAAPRFAEQWFRVPADAAKLTVVTDVDPSAADAAAHAVAPHPSVDPIMTEAKRLRDAVLERRDLESAIKVAKAADAAADVTALKKSLDELNGRVSSLFERSLIQVLVVIPPGFRDHVERRRTSLMDREVIAEGTTDYPRPLIVFNSADEKSALAHRRVEDVMESWERSILKEQLAQSGLPATLTVPINPTEVDLALQQHVSANVWSKVFPALLVLMALTGAFHPAIDLCAGEKERGTMETLLICPASRTEIVLGKFLTVLLFSITTALLNLISVGFTGKYMASMAMSGATSRLGDLAMPPVASLVWVVVTLIPIATLFSALCLAMATFARSSKEGQYYLTPLLMVTLGLMIFCLSPGTEMHPFYSIMPVIGPGLLLKGLLKASGPDAEMYLYAVPVLATSIGYSLLALWWSIDQFGSEDVLFREAEQFNLQLWLKHLIHNRGPTPTFGAAVVCVLLIFLLQFASWSPLQQILKRTPDEQQGIARIVLLMLQQLVTIAGPALLMALLLTRSLRQTFSLYWPGWTKLACAALLPFCLHPLILEMMAALQWFFPPVPAGVMDLMKDLRNAPLVLSVLAIAVTPAVCEELAFRGFLLSGFCSKGQMWLAVLLSSFAFGVIHMIPQQVFNAMLLGILLAMMCIRSRSLWPGITYHLIHNFLALSHDRFGSAMPTNGLWHYLVRMEEGTLRYQPGLLCLGLVAGICLFIPLIRAEQAVEVDGVSSSKNSS